MRSRGITYDTGFFSEPGPTTREPFDRAVVTREMHIIRDDLHCDAVRVTGGHPDRLEIAAREAAGVGLEVWFSPFICDLTADELLALLVDCAERAERLRRRGATVVLATGAELTLFLKGLLPGDTLADRLALLTQPLRLREHFATLPVRLNEFLLKAATAVRARFGGKVTYAAVPSERVDWTPFDFIAVDAYNSVAVADTYADAIRGLVASGKPVAITEFGCTTCRGAEELGARGMFIVEWEGSRAVGLKGEHIRDEEVQARHLRESLDIFNDVGVDTAFWCTFASYNLPHRHEAARDLDIASYGLVKVLENARGQSYPDMSWEPKAAFRAMAECYANKL